LTDLDRYKALTFSTMSNNNLQSLLLASATLSSDEEFSIESDDDDEQYLKPSSSISKVRKLLSVPDIATQRPHVPPLVTPTNALTGKAITVHPMSPGGTLAPHLSIPMSTPVPSSRAPPPVVDLTTNSVPLLATTTDDNSHQPTVSGVNHRPTTPPPLDRQQSFDQTSRCLRKAQRLLERQRVPPPPATARQVSTNLPAWRTDEALHMPQLSYDTTPQTVGTVVPDVTNHNDKDRVIRQMIQEFYSSIKRLELRDPAVYIKAKTIIDDCVERNGRQEAGYHDLKTVVRQKLLQLRRQERRRLLRATNVGFPAPPAIRGVGDDEVQFVRQVQPKWPPSQTPNGVSIESQPQSASRPTPIATTRREVNAQETAVSALYTHLGAYQRQLQTSGAHARHPPIQSTIVDATAPGSSVTKLASTQWTTELFATMDPLTALHFGRFMTDDPDPCASVIVQQMAQNLLDSKLEEQKAPEAVKFVDLSDDDARILFLGEIDSAVTHVADQLEIPVDAASLLFHDFNFNKDQAIQSTMSERQATFDRLGLSLRCSKKRKMPDTGDSLRSCGICFDNLDDGTPMFALPCNHDFCVDCWKGYALSTLESGLTRILTMTCPSLNCSERFTVDDARKIGPELSFTWHRAYLQAYVERSLGCRRFCPGPDCNMIAVAPPKESSELHHSATCSRCTTSFCMNCGESEHIPAKCDESDAFHGMFSSCSLWIKKNTKPCPGCRAAVEKNGGCNAMRCTRCNAKFCWLCLSLVDGHQRHTCNQATTELSAEEKQFEFFAKRFQVHRSAEGNAREQLKYWNQNGPNYLAQESWFIAHPQDKKSFCTALETLIDARNFLKNSCAASFSRRTNLAFETHQAALEASTEALNRLTEVYMEQLNEQGGERRIRKHFGMIGLHTLFVLHCLNRMKVLAGIN
jgi:hypothetical protein